MDGNGCSENFLLGEEECPLVFQQANAHLAHMAKVDKEKGRSTALVCLQS